MVLISIIVSPVLKWRIFEITQSGSNNMREVTNLYQFKYYLLIYEGLPFNVFDFYNGTFKLQYKED